MACGDDRCRLWIRSPVDDPQIVSGSVGVRTSVGVCCGTSKQVFYHHRVEPDGRLRTGRATKDHEEGRYGASRVRSHTARSAKMLAVSVVLNGPPFYLCVETRACGESHRCGARNCAVHGLNLEGCEFRSRRLLSSLARPGGRQAGVTSRFVSDATAPVLMSIPRDVQRRFFAIC